MSAGTMFAVRKVAPGPGLRWVTDQPVPSLGPTDVLVEVRFAGICGTDRHIEEWDDWSAGRVRPPVTLGHELMGVVVDVGAEVHRVPVGARVSIEGHVGCGSCRQCRTGAGHICEQVRSVGIDRDGGFAQFVAVPEPNVWLLHDAIEDRHGALMDPLGNAVHTVAAAGVGGCSVLVTGVGVIGMMAVAVARRLGAGTVVAVDVDPGHLALAGELGADHLLDANDPDWHAQARGLTGGSGPEVWLEMSGAQGAITAGFRALCNGGTVAMLGLPRGPVAIDLADGIIFKGAKLLGINGRRMYGTWYQTEAFLLRAGSHIDRLISHQLPLERFEEGFALLRSGSAVKVLLETGAAR